MMNQEDLFKKIGVILNELNSQYEFLAQNPQQLNELELALFHANADFLANHAQILIKVSKSGQPLEIQASEEVNEVKATNSTIDRTEELESEYYREPLQEEQVETIAFAEESNSDTIGVKEEELIDVKVIEEEIFKIDNEPSTFEFILNEHSEHENVADEKFDFEQKPIDELFNRPLSEEEENILAQKGKLNSVPIETDDDEIGPEPFLVSQLIEEEEFPIQEADLELKEAIEPAINKTQAAVEDPGYKPTLNELLAARTDKSLNNQNGANSISDLKQGINLNDKLLYIKDLFNGYNLAYAEAIDLANRLPNFEAADNFFKKNYAVKNNWAEKQATVDKFYALLNQRFK
ncbi:hypothetical protein [Pedobacter insulae]|uniref:Uncharacterized protein n=1 Tax=Pedobacter insulae TaxID=414048 RepID=A0A1I2Y074_9SPHI|nr:hypothetical protein [Pedobacter insulae]SFH19053.1 hypothetical protein SAMN04489864_106147 [Pedobacter insulae]